VSTGLARQLLLLSGGAPADSSEDWEYLKNMTKSVQAKVERYGLQRHVDAMACAKELRKVCNLKTKYSLIDLVMYICLVKA
jgi:hypothetical protein